VSGDSQAPATDAGGQPAAPYVSYSRIQTLLECPWKWALQYTLLKGYVEPVPMWAGVGGTAFHEATEVIDRDETWRNAG